MGQKHASKSEEILQMIEDCENRQDKLSEWEQRFIDSISVQVGRGRALTQKQEAQLEKTWNRVTS